MRVNLPVARAGLAARARRQSGHAAPTFDEEPYFAVERFVAPRLTRLGLDGPLAWKNLYRISPPGSPR